MDKQKIVSIGECMIELSHTSESTLNLNFAGDTLNTALYLARCTEKMDVKISYATAVGQNDPYSKKMLATWQNENISTELVQRLPNKLPGLYLIETDKTGERTFYYYRNESAAREYFHQSNLERLENALCEADYIHLSGISLGILDKSSQERLLNMVKTARQKGAKLCFDSNYRPALFESMEIAQTIISQGFKLTDIAYPTFYDQKTLFGDETPIACLERLQQWNIPEIVIKDGENGCLVSFENQTKWVRTTPVPPQKIADTSAAGDSFDAAYLVARIRGYSPFEAAEYGHKLASKVITLRGAIIPRDEMPVLFKQQ